MFKKDKIKHFAVGFVAGFCLSFFIPRGLAFWFGGMLGVAKESADSSLPDNHWIRGKLNFVFSNKKGIFDNYDLFATVAGSLLGVLASLFLNITPLLDEK